MSVPSALLNMVKQQLQSQRASQPSAKEERGEAKFVSGISNRVISIEKKEQLNSDRLAEFSKHIDIEESIFQQRISKGMWNYNDEYMLLIAISNLNFQCSRTCRNGQELVQA